MLMEVVNLNNFESVQAQPPSCSSPGSGRVRNSHPGVQRRNPAAADPVPGRRPPHAVPRLPRVCPRVHRRKGWALGQGTAATATTTTTTTTATASAVDSDFDGLNSRVQRAEDLANDFSRPETEGQLFVWTDYFRKGLLSNLASTLEPDTHNKY